jgi:hypothetical protein
MKLIFNHMYGFGKMQHQTVLYSPFGAIFEEAEYAEALQTGWFPVNNQIWYQSRSTRIELAKYKPSKKILKLSKEIRCYPVAGIAANKVQLLEEIYTKYMHHKGFRDVNLTIDSMIANSHGFMYYTYQRKVIAFTFYKSIGEAHLSVEFAWDYAEPKLSVGHVSLHHEINFAKMRRCKYIYLSSGYESCSIYKSYYPGFQWWTGQSWSDDVDLFRELCYADDQVKIENYKYA